MEAVIAAEKEEPLALAPVERIEKQERSKSQGTATRREKQGSQLKIGDCTVNPHNVMKYVTIRYRVAVVSAESHKRQRRKRQSVTAK